MEYRTCEKVQTKISTFRKYPSDSMDLWIASTLAMYIYYPFIKSMKKIFSHRPYQIRLVRGHFALRSYFFLTLSHIALRYSHHVYRECRPDCFTDCTNTHKKESESMLAINRTKTIEPCSGFARSKKWSKAHAAAATSPPKRYIIRRDGIDANNDESRSNISDVELRFPRLPEGYGWIDKAGILTNRF